MHYKDKISREQFMVLSYDTMIEAGNAIRLIDLMCKKFFKEQRADIELKGCKKEGCKSYPPSSMLALLVYGYFNGIASSRKLERETYRNIEVLWLMEGFQPDHWTICEFRRNSETMMKEFLKAFRRFLIEDTYANAEKIVFDGTKVKAYARREMLTVESIKEKIAGEYAKKKINERKCVVEHCFGTIKYLMGKFNLLLRGKNKAQIEFDYYTTAYNLKRLLNSSPLTDLTIKMNDFKWVVV